MKKKFILFSLLLYTGILVGCSSTKENKIDSIPNVINNPEETTPSEEVNPTEEITATPSTQETLPDENSIDGITPSHSVESQIEIIASNTDLWLQTMDYANDIYHYAVTDLDQNGRLELIASNIGGTGIYTYSTFYEINEMFDGLTTIQRDLQEGDSEVDIAVESIPAYYDVKNNTMYYIFQDFAKSGAAEYYEDKRALSLNDGRLTERLLASLYTEYAQDGTHNTWKDAEQSEITEEQYSTIEDTTYAGLEKKTITFNWKQYFQSEDVLTLTQEELINLLTDSYKGFSIQ